jgi:HlyD family secretion protein
VQKGDIVAVLDPAEAGLLDARSRAEAEAAFASASALLNLTKAQLAEAQSAKEEAARQASRLNALYDKQLAPLSAVDLAQTNLETALARVMAARAAVARAQADRDGAKLRLDPPEAKGLRRLRAPAGGKILRVHIQSETAISAGAPILEIGDPSELEVVAEFLSADAARFEPGAQVRLTGWGGPALSGRVRTIEPSASMKISALGVEEQRVNVIIDLDTLPSGGVLADGFRVDAAVTVWTGTDILQVPVAALFRDHGSWSLFRVSEGRAVLSRIEISEQNQNHAAVVSGLSEGDTVILYPGRALEDGQRVRSQEE